MFIISDELDGLRQITFSLQRLSKRMKNSNLSNKNEFTLWKARIYAWRNADLSREGIGESLRSNANSKQKKLCSNKVGAIPEVFPECAARRGSLHEDDFKKNYQNQCRFPSPGIVCYSRLGCRGHYLSEPFDTLPQYSLLDRMFRNSSLAFTA